MHKGRLFPQLYERWATPDCGSTGFAPVRAMVQVYCFFGPSFFNYSILLSNDGSVDSATGIITWTLIPRLIDGSLLGGTVKQNYVQTPADRYFEMDLEVGLFHLVGRVAVTSSPGTHWGMRPSGFHVFDLVTVDTGWYPFLNASWGGEPYFNP